MDENLGVTLMKIPAPKEKKRKEKKNRIEKSS